MLEETLRFLEPGPGKRIADLTLGGGGHSLALLQAGAEVIGFDHDAAALERAKERLSPHLANFVGIHREFGALPEGVIVDMDPLPKVDFKLIEKGSAADTGE